MGEESNQPSSLTDIAGDSAENQRQHNLRVTLGEEKMNKNIFFVVLLTVFSFNTIAQAWVGKTINVADGDTITVLQNNKTPITIRLHGIDCPEKGQAFGNQAKKFVSSIVFGKSVDVISTDTDRYGRTVALIKTSDGENLNELIIRSGYAWVYKKYCTQNYCSDWYSQEKTARSKMVGMWKDPHIMPPWEWRHGGGGSGILAVPMAPSTSNNDSMLKAETIASGGEYHGNVNSYKFHRPGCNSYNCKNCTAIFATREEAIAAGFVPCKNCKP